MSHDAGDTLAEICGGVRSLVDELATKLAKFSYLGPDTNSCTVDKALVGFVRDSLHSLVDKIIAIDPASEDAREDLAANVFD
jgi:hypothetical protein